jgi:cell division protein FtsW
MSNHPVLAPTLAACALGLLCALQLLAIWRAPTAWLPGRIEVTLGAGESLALGRHELAAPHAGVTQLVLRRDQAGNWWLRNAGYGRPLVLQRARADERTGTIRLDAGQRFQLGAAHFNVEAASDRELALADGTHRWHYDGATLKRNGQAQRRCPDASLGARAVAAWNRWAPHALTASRPLSFGGNLHCANRIGIAGVEPASAAIARDRDGRLLLTAGGAGPLMLHSGADTTDLAQREAPLAGVTSLVAGRTRYGVELGDRAIRLYPAAQVGLYAEARTDLPPQVRWDWRQREPLAPAGPLSAPLMLALLACAMVAPLASARLTARWRVLRHASAAAGALVAVAGLCALVLQRAGVPPGAAVSILLAWAGLWLALLAAPKVGAVAPSAVLLLAAGLLVQLDLGLGASDSSWLRHFQKTAAILAIGLGCMPLVWHWPRRATPLPQARLEWLLLMLAGVALAALLLQVLFGNETGVFDVQPVELAKLALAALTAHCLALAAGASADSAGTLRRLLRLATPVLLFALLLAVALVQVDDYSPLILLLVWGTAMAMAWALTLRQYPALALAGTLACLAVLGIAALRGAGVDALAHWNFYGERFLVWLDPAARPHTGQQLLLAARAIAEGGWLGADGRVGLSSLGHAAGQALRIPAVQDDFAPSFFLNRHGLAAGLALWTLQALFLWALLREAARAWHAGSHTRDFRHAWLSRFRCFALAGGAAFVFGHFLLSWGTNLAMFPIMGQPMSFLSAGGSHLLFFICPLLAFGAASAHSLEESQSCRSMSNTKS